MASGQQLVNTASSTRGNTRSLACVFPWEFCLQVPQLIRFMEFPNSIKILTVLYMTGNKRTGTPRNCLLKTLALGENGASPGVGKILVSRWLLRTTEPLLLEQKKPLLCLLSIVLRSIWLALNEKHQCSITLDATLAKYSFYKV